MSLEEATERESDDEEWSCCGGLVAREVQQCKVNCAYAMYVYVCMYVRVH